MLKADYPTGPFEVYSGRLTKEDWTCIDGTVYFEGETPYLIFSHSFEDTPDGDMCMVKLSKDLKRAEGDTTVLFSAGEAKWAKPVPFVKAEFGMDGDVYFTDGPCVLDLGAGRLYMSWSSWGSCGYAVGIAVSESGEVAGPWKQIDTPIYPENGGHGMIFKNLQGKWKFCLHFPNDKYKEKPIFMDVIEGKEGLTLKA